MGLFDKYSLKTEVEARAGNASKQSIEEIQERGAKATREIQAVTEMTYEAIEQCNDNVVLTAGIVQPTLIQQAAFDSISVRLRERAMGLSEIAEKAMREYPYILQSPDVRFRLRIAGMVKQACSNCIYRQPNLRTVDAPRRCPARDITTTSFERLLGTPRQVPEIAAPADAREESGVTGHGNVIDIPASEPRKRRRSA